MTHLSPDTRTEVALRIATMDRTPPEVVEQVEEVLKRKLSSVISRDFTSVGGTQFLVNMPTTVDRGTEKQKQDFGYGQVCTQEGVPSEGYVLSGANQEHGIVSRAGGLDREIASRFPVGTRLRILPNHACATAAQHPEYHAILPSGGIETWPRFYGW